MLGQNDCIGNQTSSPIVKKDERLDEHSSQWLRSLIFIAVIVIVSVHSSGDNSADTGSKNLFPLKTIRSQVAEYCPLWSRQERLILINVVKLSLEQTEYDDKASKMDVFLRFFPAYLAQLPRQITTDELEFICHRTEWFMKRFLSNPLPDSERLSKLRSQVESLVSTIRDEDLDITVVIPQKLRKRATDILLETALKVARNPLLPALKRPLTTREMSVARLEIRKRLNQTETSIDTTSEEELLQWYLGRISVVIEVVDGMTKPKAPDSLIKMEQKYLQSANVSNQLRDGHAYFRDLLSPPIEHIKLTEILFRELLALHIVIFSAQPQLFIGN